MIPTFASGAGIGTGIISPSASLISTGYVAGQTLAAQHLNYYLWGITAELNSILTEAGIAPILNQSNQILNAIKAIITNFVNLFWQPALASGNNSALMALLSAASASVLGIAKVDNLTIQSAAGVLSLIQNAGAYAPLPQSAAGVGQVVSVQSADGGALSLPAGGTWWFFNVHAISDATLVFQKATAAISQSGIAAGGTQIAAGAAGYYLTLDCIRIA